MNDPILLWFLAGVLLMLLEFIAPGLILLFFGFGALVVSFSSYLGLVDSLQSQMILFSIGSILSLILLRKYVKAWFVGKSSEEKDSNQEFIGKVVKVVTAIPGGVALGRVELNGSDWKAYGSDPHEKGSMVRVMERDGLKLKVESAE